jgi:hypothetical protein
MYRALLYIVVGTASFTVAAAAEQKSWNKIRYVGGTVAVKASPYDWNTTLTASRNPDSIVLVIAPAKLFTPRQTVRIKPAQVISLSCGLGAWRRVAETPGAQLPSKPPTLFGLFENHSYIGIVYQTDDGKRAAVLLDSFLGGRLLQVLEALSGRHVDCAP